LLDLPFLSHLKPITPLHQLERYAMLQLCQVLLRYLAG
jgi:hypothetical protein